MKSIIFIAPPASGKGTFSKILEEKYGYKHLALGDCLREQVDNGNEVLKELMDNGKLVSDEIIASIIQEKISTLKDKPFIIDGCPRTLIQAKMLQTALEDEKVTNVIALKLHIDVEVAKERILGRYICKCGRSYNIYNEDLKPKVEGICDKCGNDLTQRSDDNEEKIVKRFNEYEDNIKPIKEFYESENILHEVDASGKVEDVLETIEGIIND